MFAWLATGTACSLAFSSEGLSGAPNPADSGADSSTSMNVDAPDVVGEAAPPMPADCDGGGDPDLVGYWPLDEGAGNVVHDCSGRGHDGVVITTPAAGGWTTGVFRNAWRADGTAGCIELGAPEDLRVESVAFTFSAWLQILSFADDAGTSRYTFGRSSATDFAGWRVGSELDRVDFRLRPASDASGAIEVAGASSQPLNVWVHVAAVFEPSVRLALYVNGTQVDAKPPIAAILPEATATVRLGCRSDGKNVMDAVIDDVRLYRRALSATEIAKLADR